MARLPQGFHPGSSGVRVQNELDIRIGINYQYHQLRYKVDGSSGVRVQNELDIRIGINYQGESKVEVVDVAVNLF